MNITILENIIDAFEVMRNNGEKPGCNEELSFLIKCLEDDLPYNDFFDGVYLRKAPFEYEKHEI